MSALTNQPIYLQYMAVILSLLPESLCPEGNPVGSGMLSITFHQGDETIAIYRTISRYADGNMGIQDEVMINHGNGGGWQLNFEVNSAGEWVKFPAAAQPSQLMQEVFTRILAWSKQDGAAVYCRRVHRYTSRGGLWVEESSHKIPQLPLILLLLPRLGAGDS